MFKNDIMQNTDRFLDKSYLSLEKDGKETELEEDEIRKYVNNFREEIQTRFENSAVNSEYVFPRQKNTLSNKFKENRFKFKHYDLR